MKSGYTLQFVAFILLLFLFNAFGIGNNDNREIPKSVTNYAVYYAEHYALASPNYLFNSASLADFNTQFEFWLQIEFITKNELLILFGIKSLFENPAIGYIGP